MRQTHFDKYQKLFPSHGRPEWRSILENLSDRDAWLMMAHYLGDAGYFQKIKLPPLGNGQAMGLLMELMHKALSSTPEYSFGAALGHPVTVAIANLLEKFNSWPLSRVQTTITLVYHLLSYEHFGKRVYEVSPGLAEQLANTKLHGLLTDDLRLPYESILIQVPERLNMKVWNKDTGWHVLSDVYVSQDTYVGAGAEDSGKGWRVMLCGKSNNPEDTGDDAISYFWVPLPEGRKLDDCLDILEKKIREQDGQAEFGPMVDAWRGVFSWVMNVILYATWSEPGERIFQNKEARLLWSRITKLSGNKRKRKELLAGFQKLDARPVILLGKNVLISRGFPEGGHESESGGALSGNNCPSWVRVRVSGHWRNQPHGPGSTLRKFIWIEPFWKGPDDAPVSTPKHRAV